ncbi:MAG: hypothetical protein ACKVZH_16135 [Blastocatellia bacterium]
MKSHRRKFIATTLLSVGALPMAAQAQDKQADEARDVSLRGKIVCLTEELDKRFNVLPNCDDQHHVYSLKTNDDKIHPLLPTESAAAVWMDERFRQRDLQITARSFPNTNHIEVIKIQSLINAKLYDLYYYCDICAITAFKPQACECCQEQVEFRETLAKNDH